jgi:hypothetical protein
METAGLRKMVIIKPLIIKQSLFGLIFFEDKLIM